MPDLDFAFLSLINSNRRGVTWKKLFLDRLASLLFVPRLEKLKVELTELNLGGRKIRLPVDEAGWCRLNPEKQKVIINKSFKVFNKLKLPSLAVDRRLKKKFIELPPKITLQFGDQFLKALALVLIREHLRKNRTEKIIIIGDTENLCEFITEISIYDIPLSLQGYDLSRYEILAHRLLYEKGQVISTNSFNPRNWGEKELVVILDCNSNLQQIGIRYPLPAYIRLNDNNVRITPRLENALMSSGIENKMSSLAPLMETCFLLKAGFSYLGEEQGKANNQGGWEFLHLREIGDRLGLWDLFLDKVI